MKKKGALELSIGTIVIIVIAMSLLILGIILVRQVMCAGIILTDEVTTETENEIINLFGTNEWGIKCMGEGKQVKLGDGGSRQIICVANINVGKKYRLTLTSANLLKGTLYGKHADPANNVRPDIMTGTELITDSGWKGPITSGKKTITVATLNIPRDVDASTIKLVFKEEKGPIDTGNYDPGGDIHPLIIDLVPVGSFTSAIC